MLFELEYLLPLRSVVPMGEEFRSYVARLARLVDVTVVDASEPSVFAVHAGYWASGVRHLPVPPMATRVGGSVCNGKVVGVVIGLEEARHDKVVIADDDVRYCADDLRTMSELLECHGVVRPQNYWGPRTWHTQWDAARSLINRAISADYPGTLGVRRHLLPDGYRADVLFENLEMIRTVIANGGHEYRADELFVRRVPPTTAHFLGQRVRQAYDSQAQPARLVTELLLLPALVAQARRPRGYLAWMVAAWALAELGRQRRGAAAFFPVSASMCAPLWVVERALTAWAAVGYRVRGGMPYAGSRLKIAASRPRQLRAVGSAGAQGRRGRVSTPLIPRVAPDRRQPVRP